MTAPHVDTWHEHGQGICQPTTFRCDASGVTLNHSGSEEKYTWSTWDLLVKRIQESQKHFQGKRK